MKHAVFTLLSALALAGCQDVVAPAPTTAAADGPSRYLHGGVTSIYMDCPSQLWVDQVGFCSVRAYNSFGDQVTPYGAIYYSSNPSVATFGAGTINAVGPGSATLVVDVDGVDFSRTVQVNTLNASRVDVSPLTVRLGNTGYGSARVYLPLDIHVSDAPITWSVDNPAIATVDARTGKVTPHAVGTTTLRATSGGKTGTAQLVVAHNVSLSAPDYVYHQNATATATPVPGGSYYYTWATRRCTMSGACPNQFSPATSGVNQTSYTDFVSRNEISLTFRVEIRAYAGGPVLAMTTTVVRGEAEPLPTTDPGSCAPRLIC